MRSGQSVTVTFADGQVLQGQLVRCEKKPSDLVATSQFDSDGRRIIARPSLYRLELFAEEPTAPLPYRASPETEDPAWGTWS